MQNRLITNIAIILLGIFCVLVVISFRSWTIQYGNCAEAVSKLFVTDKNINTKTKIIKFLEINSRKPHDNFSQYCKRRSNIIVIGFIFITLTPFINTYPILNEIIKQSWISLSIIILIMFLYMACLIVHHYHETNKALTRPKELTWIIKFNDIK